MHDDRASAPADAAPWKEPRGPHLPDAFQRIPALAWVFIAVSLARLWMLVDTARLGPAPDLLLVGGAVMNAVSSLAVLLTPAALLICHPDAPRRAPILTFGVVSGWRLGVLAGVLALLAHVLFAVLSILVAPNVNLNGVLFLASALFAAGPASLLLAVAAGLPSLEPPPATSGD